MIDSFIIPEDSQLEDMGGTVFYHSPNIHSIVVPATVGAFGRALFGSTNGPKNINSITLKQNYMISPYANANNGYVGNQTL
jgi:hypothetical protein